MRTAILSLVVGLGVLALVTAATRAEKEKKKMETRVFEMRTYYAPAGKMKALHARFRDHTCQQFLVG